MQPNYNPSERLWPHISVSSPDDCWLWNRAKTKAGYGLLTINRKNYFAHRLVWQDYNKTDIPLDHDICHTCDNPACCNPSHLFSGSRRDNLLDASRKGRIKHGSKHIKAILHELDITTILNLYDTGIAQKIIAAQFGVSRTTISAIVTGRNWKHSIPDSHQTVDRRHGINHPLSKLTPEQVIQIRKLLASKLSQRKIAAQFSVSRGTIDAIAKGITWQNVQ